MATLWRRIKRVFVHYSDDDAIRFSKLRREIKKSGRLKRKILGVRYQNLLYRNNASIPLGTNIKGDLSFPHGLSGIFISEGAMIGSNVTLFQQVTIGSNTLDDTKHSGAPVIGDNVYIGAGAKIIGGIRVGNNVRIGANATVYKDVPDNCTVVSGAGMRIIPHEEPRNNNFKRFEDYHGSGK